MAANVVRLTGLLAVPELDPAAIGELRHGRRASSASCDSSRVPRLENSGRVLGHVVGVRPVLGSGLVVGLLEVLRFGRRVTPSVGRGRHPPSAFAGSLTRKERQVTVEMPVPGRLPLVGHVDQTL